MLFVDPRGFDVRPRQIFTAHVVLEALVGPTLVVVIAEWRAANATMRELVAQRVDGPDGYDTAARPARHGLSAPPAAPAGAAGRQPGSA